MTKLFKAQMHQRPTSETLVKDAILEPKDEIALPDRTAPILRRAHQLSRHDGHEFLDLEKDHENIAKEQAQQIEIRTATGDDPGGSIAEERSMRPDGHESHNFSNQLPGQPPGGGPPRLRVNGKGGQGRPPSNAPSQTVASSSSGPPPPGSNGTTVMAASSSTQTFKAEQLI